ncbi:SDR family oxidoreductase [Echinicola strongylocentroti]|uniref:SDR family oxidoreductase n=1 Tax=Echinicola strongylocentroti TaxID=1795355 RepID=UPI001FE3611E|nr:SDR family oxidoreductase [Echinicola strongylocentroti]
MSALVRDSQKAESLKNRGVNLRIGNYEDFSSLKRAFEGVDQLLFISGSEIKNRFEQHKNVVETAKQAGVKHIVYTSYARNDKPEPSQLGDLAESHIQTEEKLKNSGVDYTILQNNLYLDFIPYFIGDKVLETQTILLPAENGKVSAGLRSEYAEATANVLRSEGHKNKVYRFTNTQSVNYSDIANMLSEITGKKINYVSPSLDEYVKTLSDAGIPTDFINLFGSFAVAQAKEELDVKSNDLEQFLGRKPTSFKDFLINVYGK